ncbi:hypothetical protein [Actinomadura verrucosospora]|uniref:hypothetical protein n=1 Tax=Actinomadura verrucosospora TaxID=46165 RepID=UPI0031E53B14
MRVPGRYPSPRVRGRGPVIGYVTKVYFTESYPAPVRDGLTVALPEPEARARALDSMVAEYGNVVHVLHRDEESTFEVRYHEDGRFIWYLLTLNERAENDPELLEAAIPNARAIPLWPAPAPPRVPPRRPAGAEGQPGRLRTRRARLRDVRPLRAEGGRVLDRQ